MTTLNQIVNTPLPTSRNYRELREIGLTFIQANSGTDWTNLNPADPGVTILGELCYALTELGYCANFPIKDILTESNGEINTKDQFYLPKDILTTAPVTADDYRKYLIDRIPEIGNVLIMIRYNQSRLSQKVYDIYLKPGPTKMTADDLEVMCLEAYNILNTIRGLGEYFNEPKIFTPTNTLISGTIYLDSHESVAGFILQAKTVVSRYIFPDVELISYQNAEKAGYTIDQIYDGPKLTRGYIPSDVLGKKRNELITQELTALLMDIPEVVKVENLLFDFDGLEVSEIITGEAELITIDWNRSLIIPDPTNPRLTLKIGDQKVRVQSDDLIRFNSKTVWPVDQSQSEENKVPEGLYREINSYYSIQHTFPEIYGVGHETNNRKKTSQTKAQIKQLKGYLTLFDQVLANQFSQLANIPALFSFKNSTSSAPSDLTEFKANQSKLENLGESQLMKQNPLHKEKPHSVYPVPYATFSPTYFCQSLYNVPNIRPLLKGYKMYNYKAEVESVESAEMAAWNAYQSDPYNPYMRGVMNITVSDDNNFERRNAMLDHLLARHGESPEIIDRILRGSQYSGSKTQDLIIFKSLYLQNLGDLSYNRYKAYNFESANKISNTLPDLPTLEQLEDVNNIEINGAKDKKTKENAILIKSWFEGLNKDFVFLTDTINKLEEIKPQDYINFSAFELKLSLLFGIKPFLQKFVVTNYVNPGLTNCPDSELCNQVAFWLLEQRKGFILLEPTLLFRFDMFEIYVRIEAEIYKIEQEFDAVQIKRVHKKIKSGDYDLDENSRQKNIKIEGELHPLVREVGLDDELEFQQEGSGIEVAIQKVQITESELLFEDQLVLLFPEFLFANDRFGFTSKLNFFLEAVLPVQLSCKYFFLDTSTYAEMIPAYADWVNHFQFGTISNQGTKHPIYEHLTNIIIKNSEDE